MNKPDSNFLKTAFIKTLDVSFLYDDKEFSTYYEQMPAYRRKKIDFYKFKKDKALSLGAGILMNEMIEYLKENLPASEGNFEVDFREQGRPFFKNLPGIHFSLAPSVKIVIAAASSHKIGVDVEEISGNKDINLTEWTKAESYIKAEGLSVSDYLDKKIRLPADSFFKQWQEDGHIFCVYENSIL